MSILESKKLLAAALILCAGSPVFGISSRMPTPEGSKPSDGSVPASHPTPSALPQSSAPISPIGSGPDAVKPAVPVPSETSQPLAAPAANLEGPSPTPSQPSEPSQPQKPAFDSLQDMGKEIGQAKPDESPSVANELLKHDFDKSGSENAGEPSKREPQQPRRAGRMPHVKRGDHKPLTWADFKPEGIVDLADGSSEIMFGQIGKRFVTVRYDGQVHSPTRGKIFTASSMDMKKVFEDQGRQMDGEEIRMLEYAVSAHLQADSENPSNGAYRDFLAKIKAESANNVDSDPQEPAFHFAKARDAAIKRAPDALLRSLVYGSSIARWVFDFFSPSRDEIIMVPLDSAGNIVEEKIRQDLAPSDYFSNELDLESVISFKKALAEFKAKNNVEPSEWSIYHGHPLDGPYADRKIWYRFLLPGGGYAQVRANPTSPDKEEPPIAR